MRIFQDFNLLPGLTAAENVALPLELNGLSARKARVDGLRALERLGLGERAAHYPDQLSGMTAVVVAHDAQLASWADRVVFLRNGRVTDQTTPATGPESLLAPRDTR